MKDYVRDEFLLLTKEISDNKYENGAEGVGEGEADNYYRSIEKIKRLSKFTGIADTMESLNQETFRYILENMFLATNKDELLENVQKDIDKELKKKLISIIKYSIFEIGDDVSAIIYSYLFDRKTLQIISKNLLSNVIELKYFAEHVHLPEVEYRELSQTAADLQQLDEMTSGEVALQINKVKAQVKAQLKQKLKRIINDKRATLSKLEELYKEL